MSHSSMGPGTLRRMSLRQSDDVLQKAGAEIPTPTSTPTAGAPVRKILRTSTGPDLDVPPRQMSHRGRDSGGSRGGWGTGTEKAFVVNFRRLMELHKVSADRKRGAVHVSICILYYLVFSG